MKRVVEGSGRERGRPVRYWEVWNEPELAYAWNPSVGDFNSYLQTAVMTHQALDAYRRQAANPNGKAIRIGLGSFADASTAAQLLPALDAAGVPFDFISFHAYDDDPLAIVAKIEQVAAARQASAGRQDVELALAEWGPSLDKTTLDPKTMDLALHNATVIALGAAAGLTHAHHSIFWEFDDGEPAALAFIDHHGTPKPAYYAYALLAQVIGAGSARLAPVGAADGRLDGGMGAVLAARDGAGKVRVLLVNRSTAARTATVDAVPTAVTVFDDPARPPHAVAPSAVMTVPPRALLLAEYPGPVSPAAQIVFEAPDIPGGGSVQEIYTMNLDGSNRLQITHDGLSKFLPHFSPDGTRLVYTKFLVGEYGTPNAQTDVVVYDFASAKETRLTYTGRGFQPAWSPDGTRIAYGSIMGDSLHIMNSDGSGSHLIGGPSGAPDDLRWADFAWSSDDWILFVVLQTTNDCVKARLDKIRPDGSARTQVTDGGPNCTLAGKEPSGDADPGFSADGKTIYSSRGFPRSPAGIPPATERRLYAFSSDAWTPGKLERDLSVPTAADCIEGVPKGSPDGTRVLLFRACAGEPHAGVTLTDATGSYRTWIADGFGADWNPVASRGAAPR
ncbi:MAG: PD40 domain-containing protein [Acidobacteria bacterium]|nr:PD40 domain-containing protein [Acidobacteriota bacterium]